MKQLLLTCIALLFAVCANAKTLIIYYSFTNNVHTIAGELQRQTGADLLRIEPAEEGIDYAANNYAAGSALIQAIRNAPNDAASYPAIKPVEINLSDYDTVIIGAPLWWSNMAAPLQTFLFQHGSELKGKHVGLIVSSASSGVSGVEADAHRLIPDGNFLQPTLWVRSHQTSACSSLIADWLEAIDYGSLTAINEIIDNAHRPGLIVSQGRLMVNGRFDRQRLHTIAGTKVAETTDAAIETSGLTPGIYISEITNGKVRTNRKIYIAN